MKKVWGVGYGVWGGGILMLNNKFKIACYLLNPDAIIIFNICKE